MAENSNNRFQIKNTGLLIGTAFFALLALTALILSIMILAKGGDEPETTSKKPHKTSAPTTDVQDPTAPDTVPETLPLTFMDYSVESASKIFGSLILIDEDHGYKIGSDMLLTRTEMSKLSPEDLKDRYGFVHLQGNLDFTVRNTTLYLNEEAAAALAKMMADFNAETGHNDIQVRNAYYYDSSEQICYNATGLYVDLQIVKNDKLYPLTFAEYKAEYYDWLAENGYKYGFVHVRDEGEKYSSYRYVGALHAGVMHEYLIGLDSYLTMLKAHGFDNPLEYTAENADEWIIYYAPAEEGESTALKVVEGGIFEISGDNQNGFIVATKS